MNPVTRRLLNVAIVAAMIFTAIRFAGEDTDAPQPSPAPGVDTSSVETSSFETSSSATPGSSRNRAGDVLARAFRERQSGIQIEASGTVQRVLADDNDGSRHQRFIVELATGQTLLIAHNIDLAPRVAGLEPGDRVSFFGEYEWNEQGGVIHWTHHDPAGTHVGGWVRHDGRTYE